MLYQTLDQPRLLMIFLLVGIGCGIIFDIGNFIKFLFANKKIPTIIIDFIQTSISIVLVFYINLKVNYGEVRLFPIIITMTSFSIERITLGKFIAKLYISCYNKLQKLNNKLWGKIKHGKTNKSN